MKIVVVPTVAEQMEAGWTSVVDPEGVRASSMVPIRVFEHLLGHVKNLRVEDGRLVGDASVDIGFEGVVEGIDDGAVIGMRLLGVDLSKMRARPMRS